MIKQQLKKDEMQIRDRYSDFILIQLKDLLTKNKNIKVIMISASSGMIDLMQKFFPQCPIMKSLFSILFD